MIPGVEGTYEWTPPGASEPALTLYPDSTEFDDVWPRVVINDVSTQDLAEQSDNHDPKVGTAGTTGRASHRRSKLITISGMVRARNFLELRSIQQTFRDAFADQAPDGRMDVAWPEGLPEAVSPRYFNASALGLAMPDRQGSPFNLSAGAERPFTLALRNHSGQHFEELTLAGFKQAIVDLGPALYWALDSVDGANDLSPNNRDGTAQGGVTIGGYSAGLLPGISGDSATDFDGSNDHISSAYAGAFSAGSTRTFVGWGKRDTDDSYEAPIADADGFGPAFRIKPPSGEPEFLPDGNDEAGRLSWLDTDDRWDIGDTVFWAVVFRDDHPAAGQSEGELFLNGVSRGLDTGGDYADSGNFQVGALGTLPNPEYEWDGALSHVAVFERALTAQEIAEIYEWGATGRRAYW